MDFRLSDEQRLLQDSVRKTLAKEYSFAKRAVISASEDLSAKMWHTFAEHGWFAASFPEEVGGFATSGIESMVVMEELGRHLVIEPVLWSVVIAGQMVLGMADGKRRQSLCEAVIAGGLRLGIALFESEVWDDLSGLSTRAAGVGGRYVLSGCKQLVYGARSADKFVVAATTPDSGAEFPELTLFLVDRHAQGISLRDGMTLDGRPFSTLTLDDVPVEATEIVGSAADGRSLIENALDHGIAALCAQALGSMAHLIEATAAHLKTRQQYGAPLARLQALQHRMADMYVAVELSRSMCQVATMSLQAERDIRSAYTSAAKVQMSQAARFVGQQAVQLHGAMGMSEALDISHHFTFLTLFTLLLGDERYHLDRFSRLSERLEESDIVGFSSAGLQPPPAAPGGQRP